MSEVVVEIPQGKLRGKKETSVLGTEFYCFHRIPYAKPPVGELRFKAPQPGERWTGVRDATEEGPPFATFDRLRKCFSKGSSEDGLFINVYCRQNPSSLGGRKYPVLVWIHGGGFEFGTGNRTFSGPDYIIEQDVIMVTFNYRLGVFGFLSLETVECPGNFGLKDQQLALRWVKNNIGHFGGNPENITIFGVSAGAASVHYQLLCLANEGLFKRAIMQSGCALNRWAHSRQPRKNAFVLGKRLGCDTQDDKVLLDFLRRASVEDIVVKGLGVINETEGEALGEFLLNFTFVPSVEPAHEGAIITKHPWVLMKEGKFLDVPLITGITSDEMILGVRNPEDYPRFTTVEEFQALIPRDIRVPRNSDRSLAIAKRIKEFYCKDNINLHNYIEILSDNFFNYGIYRNVKCRTTIPAIKSPTYLYLFSYEGNQPFLKHALGLNNIKGAAHGDDTAYLFKSIFSVADKIQSGSRDYNFMTKLTKLWANFATTGVPTLDEPGFGWKATSFNDLEYLNLGDRFTMEKGLLKSQMEFWEEIYSSYYDQTPL